MMIKGFQKLSLIEYPGKLSAIVFVGKCDFRCHFCYNIDLVKNYKKLPETNGSNPGMIKELIDEELVDYIAMDIKAPLEKYDEVAGVKVDKEKIQQSINIIRNSGVDYEFRSTVTPKYFKKGDALAIGKWLKGSKQFYLQQFRPGKTLDKALEKVKPYPPEKLKEFAKIMKPYLKSVKIRGI